MRGVESAVSSIGRMAYPDPRLAYTTRHMAHPVRHGPVVWASALARRITPKEGRRRELAIVLALLLAATAVSASLPGGWTTATPSPSPVMLAMAETSDPTPTGTPSPTPTPTPTPTSTPTPTPTATPTPTPTPTATPTPAPVKAPTKAPAKTATVYSFVALGDSLTSGYNDPGPAWPSRLDSEDANLVLYHNAGIPGDLTSGMLSRLDRDVFAYSPKVLFILGGTNDLGHGVAESTVVANLRAIIAKAKAHGIKIFLITVPPNSSSAMTAKIDSLNAAILHLANSYAIVLIDIHTPLSASNGLILSKYTVDGLHFNGAGAQLVANTIYARIHRQGY